MTFDFCDEWLLLTDVFLNTTAPTRRFILAHNTPPYGTVWWTTWVVTMRAFSRVLTFFNIMKVMFAVIFNLVDNLVSLN